MCRAAVLVDDCLGFYFSLYFAFGNPSTLAEDGFIIAGTPGMRGCQNGRGKQIKFHGTGRLLVLDLTFARENVGEVDEPFVVLSRIPDSSRVSV